MKNLLIKILILLSLNAINGFSQGNFIIEEGKVVFEKVYESGAKNLNDIIYGRDYFKNIIVVDSVTYTFDLIKHEIDRKKFKEKGVSMPAFTDRPLFGACKINIKGDRYKLTVRDIRLYTNMTGQYGIEYYLKKGQWNYKNQGNMDYFNLMSAALDDIFVPKLVKDW